MKVSAQDRNFIELVIVALLIALMVLLAAQIGMSGSDQLSLTAIPESRQNLPFCYKDCTLIQP